MTPADPQAAPLDALAACGPFFAVTVHTPRSPLQGPWRSLAELVEEPSVLRTRVEAVRTYLATGRGCTTGAVEWRVAASVTHLGLVARVVSPLLALTALHGAPSVPVLREVRWQPHLGGTFPLSLPRDTLTSSGRPARETAALVLEGLVAPLTRAVGELSVSPRTLWGNVASAVNGARTVLTATAPTGEERIARSCGVFLAHEALRGTYADAAGGQPFRRRNCCLIYRAMPGTDRAAAVCGDCVLADR